jgi:hypothetical protein
MVFILIVVVSLVAWALHLMQQAVQRREFSLMLAGFLVSSAAAAMMSVYFLMGHYVGYMTEMANRSFAYEQQAAYSDYSDWATSPENWSGDWTQFVAEETNHS